MYILIVLEALTSSLSDKLHLSWNAPLVKEFSKYLAAFSESSSSLNL